MPKQYLFDSCELFFKSHHFTLGKCTDKYINTHLSNDTELHVTL